MSLGLLYLYPLAIIDSDGYVIEDQDSLSELEIILYIQNEGDIEGISNKAILPRIVANNTNCKSFNLLDGRTFKIVCYPSNGIFFAD